LEEWEKMMAKTNHLGALAAAAGTLVAVGLLQLMLMLVDVGPAEATFPGKPGKIAYEGNDATDSEIYTIKPGGEERLRLRTTLRTTSSLRGGAVRREAPLLSG
jgi:hypothetical protein